jgi:hypothetical protein
MLELVFSLLATLRAALRSRRGLVLENLALRHQLGVLVRSASRPLRSRPIARFWRGTVCEPASRRAAH